jgi:DNA-binding SARP family transcriptional activator
VAAVLLLAQMSLQRNQAERAAEAAGRSLEIDPLQEAGYELLMHAYLALGRAEAVLAAYERYLIHFCAELDVQPSKALENLSQRRF